MFEIIALKCFIMDISFSSKYSVVVIQTAMYEFLI